MTEKVKVPTRANRQIGMNLRQAIFRAKQKNPALTQREIARLAEVNPVTLSRIIGGSGASVKMITKIAEVIGANPERILTKGMRMPKFTAHSFDEILNDDRILEQFAGWMDGPGIENLRTNLQTIIRLLENRRKKLRDAGYR